MNGSQHISIDAKKDARSRILEAAGEIFSEYGYREATVRQICKKAGVNTAAINYHFRDKESLYIETVRYWKDIAFQEYPIDPGICEDAPAETRLEAFIRSFIMRIFSQGKQSWFGKLMAREFIEPTRALDAIVDETIRPSLNALSSIIRQLSGEAASKEEVFLSCASIVGQCLYFFYARPVIEKILDKKEFKEEEIDKVIGHVISFSSEAIKGLAKPEKGANI